MCTRRIISKLEYDTLVYRGQRSKFAFFDSSADGESEPDAASDGNTNPQVQSEAHQALATFWDRVTDEIKKIGTVRRLF